MQITLIQNILSFSNISLFLSILLTILFFSLSTMIVPLSLFLFCIYLFPLCQSVPMFAFVSFYLPPLNSISSSVRSSLGMSVFLSLFLALSLSLSLSLSVYLPLTSCTLRAVFFLPYLATFDSFTNCVGQKRKINARRAGNYQSTIKHP